MWRDSSVAVARDQPQRIGEYRVEDEIGRGSMSVVYSATRGGRSYAVKLLVPTSAVDAIDLHVQFRREAAAIARLDHPSLVRVIEVGEFEGRPYLVMDLADGESLDRRISRSPLSDDATIELARNVAGALVEVHRYGLIHRDIKPANIVVNSTGLARLVDFGLASGETESDDVVGTMHYAAPEQVGVIKRAVGAPADMYALGATLFECLTGATPFAGRSHTDLLHDLAARPAPDLRDVRPGTRPALAAIISKLLAKDPDDRYQSARGLLADLGRLARLDEALRTSQPISLGDQDAPSSGDFELPLIGRKRELTRLLRAWHRSRKGECMFVQVVGEGGSGKTRLVREVVSRASDQGALVLAGKAQEAEVVPFGPLREAIDLHIAKVLRLPEAARMEAVEAVRRAAGEWSPLIRRLSVGLARLLSDGGECRTLEPETEHQRFYEALASFFSNLGSATRPLVLVLNDTQWLDEGSLRVLGRMASDSGSGHLLVLSTSRDTSASSVYSRVVAQRSSERVVLGPLGIDSVEAIISARLGGRPIDPVLVDRLAGLTSGNPFAIGEYLRTFLDAGVVRPEGGRWSVDVAALDAVELPGDVIELVVSRMHSLGSETERLAALAAVIGGRFYAELLARVSGASADAVARSIEEMVRAGLVERRFGDHWAFVHDRVREAATARLDPMGMRDAHQAIAQAIESFEDLSTPDLFALARHYAAGHVDRDPRRVAETNLEAGLRALDDHANEDAFELLDRARVISHQAGLHADLAPKLLEALGRACAMTGRLVLAQTHLEEALGYAADDEARFRLQHLLTLTYASQGRNDDALGSLYRSFEVLGRPLPRWIVAQVLVMAVLWVATLLMRLTGFGWGRSEGADRERRRVVSQLNYAGSMIALFQGRPVLMMQFVVRDFYNVHFLGPTAETAIAWSVYGAVLGMFQLKGVMERYTGMGVAMAEQLGDNAALAVAHAYQAMGQKWSGDLVRGNASLLDTLPELYRHVPGSWYTAMMICEQAYSYLHAGRSLAAIEHVQSNTSQIERTNSPMFLYNTLSVQYAEMMLTGETAEGAALWARLEQQYPPLSKTIYARLARCTANLEVMVDQEETGPEVDAEIAEFHDLVSEDYYSNAARMLAGYARMNQLLKAPPERRGVARRRLRNESISLMVRAMVPVFSCHTLVWRAVMARLDGRSDKARRLLDEADRRAIRSDCRRAAFYIAVERARLARDTGASTADVFASSAVDIALSERWRGKAARVRQEFSLPDHRDHGNSARSVAGTAGVSRSVDQARRYADALLQVSLASASSLDSETLARNALKEVSRVLGAERALFFLLDPDTGGLTLNASIGTDAQDISRTVVRRVVETRSAVVFTGTDNGEALGSDSILTHGLRSIMAAPLMLRDRLMGVVYLDSRLAKGVFNEDDVGLLLGVSNHIAIAMETARAARIEAERSALQGDFELLGAVQSLLLPKCSEFAGAGLIGGGFYQPALQCGGDWWWAETEPDGSVTVVVADVNGHGAGPAMITSAVAGAFHTMRDLHPDATSAEILEELHRRVQGFGGGFHLTMSVIRVDPAAGYLQWANAAAPGIFVLTGGKCVFHQCPSGLIGADAPLQAGERTIPFSPGDRLLVCTDGMLELKRQDGRELGARQVARLFERLAGVPADELAVRLGIELNGIRSDQIQEDDITFVIVEALNTPGIDDRPVPNLELIR